ncbi:NADP-dependent oxidoreductase [Sandaracinus amylolyticus]|uniref:NADP-dependent oxidoreductase n=1 Tax=Sandaracinus amylolyticus TaxID=927083 RepID=UPI001F21052E|nr:NADP-dependent oxidoreductase [Sandaracinus amylolyticus]UJR78952.1 Zinc-containing alcohol dehydrogenase [Sandaracinus amylolyticus]
MATMRAVRFHEYGGPEVLRYDEVPCPEPGAGEILVRVHAASVNPIDWKIAAGAYGLSLPRVAGHDFSGVVAGVGEGVAGFAVEDRVFGRHDGADAELVVVRPEEIAKTPPGLDHARAATIPTAGLTAWQALFDLEGAPTMDLQPGQTVLIHGAAGGVGTFAVQLAKQRGARVIATARAAHEAYLRSLGADDVVDYSQQRFESVARDVDGVLDTIGGETQRRSFDVIRPGGALVSLVGLAPTSKQRAEERGVRAVGIVSKTSRPVLEELARLVENGTIDVEIAARFPLAKAREAYAQSRDGHTQGKIVLEAT